MPLTVADVLAMPALDLRLLAGEGGTAGTVQWAHASELGDPTPWLEGRELLMTTGLWLAGTPAREYVARLVDVGVAGIAFGVGVQVAEAPADLVDACDHAGLPLLEVPRPTPFLAIAKAVSTRLAAERYDEIQRAYDAQRALTTAALERGGAPGVVPKLADAVGGWAVLCDRSGRPIVEAPAGAGSGLAALEDELARVRAGGMRSAAAVSGAGGHAIVQPLGARDGVRGLLVVGRAGVAAAFGPLDRIVVQAAVALLSLELARAEVVAERERRVDAAAVGLALAGGLDRLDAYGVPTDLVRVVACDAPPQSVADALDGAEVAALVAGAVPEAGGLTVGLVADTADDDLRDLALVGTVGVSDRVPVASVAAALAEACRAHRWAVRVGTRFATSADVGLAGLLAETDAAALAAWAGRTLGSLAGDDVLRGSVRAWLVHNGQWDVAAAELGVHRHTLRHRVRRAEDLLGHSLDPAYVRAEVLLALDVVER